MILFSVQLQNVTCYSAVFWQKTVDGHVCSLLYQSYAALGLREGQQINIFLVFGPISKTGRGKIVHSDRYGH